MPQPQLPRRAGGKRGGHEGKRARRAARLAEAGHGAAQRVELLALCAELHLLPRLAEGRALRPRCFQRSPLGIPWHAPARRAERCEAWTW